MKSKVGMCGGGGGIVGGVSDDESISMDVTTRAKRSL